MSNTVLVNGKIYTYGEWVSQTLTNALCRLPSGISTVWGLLSWTEENTGGDFEGFVRVDILKASDDSILKSNLVLNRILGGVDLSLYSTVGTNDIKIRFKLYVTELTPIVKDIRLSFKYGGDYNMITDLGKNMILDRAFKSSPTYTVPSLFMIGDSSSAPQATDTTLGNSVEFSGGSFTKAFETDYPYFDTTELSVSFRGVVSISEGNGSTVAESGIVNTDGSPLLFNRDVHTGIVKEGTSIIAYVWTYELV